MRSNRTYVLGSLITLLVSSIGCEATTEPLAAVSDISRVEVVFVPQGGGTTVSAYIDDPDGMGPLEPGTQVGSLVFVPGTTYSGSFSLENRLSASPEDVTAQVLALAEEYRLYPRVAGEITGAGFVVTPTDADAGGRPVGLQFTAAVHPMAGGDTGTLEVVLCRYGTGQKSAASTTCAGEAKLTIAFAIAATF